MRSCVRPCRRVQPALGTFVEIALRGIARDHFARVTNEAFTAIRRLEKMMNFFDPTSELSQLNRQRRGRSVEVSPELWDVLSLGASIETQCPRSFQLMPRCRHGAGACYELSRGRVTRSGPCEFDLGGIAKGFIVDHAFEKLTAALSDDTPDPDILVNAGGDLRVRAAHTIEVRVPSDDGDCGYQLELEDAAVATSSLTHSRAGAGTATASYPASSRRSATSAAVVASRCAVADAFTKVMLFGDWSPFTFVPFHIHAGYCFDRRGQWLA